MALIYLLLLFLLTLVHSSHCGSTVYAVNRRLGINYGILGNNLLSPYRSIEIIKSMNAGRVKLYNADAETLKLLAGTDLWVSIMVPNDQIELVASSQNASDLWVQSNVLPYYPQTMIRFILVGNEILSSYNPAQWTGLVPAMRNIRNSLKTQGIHNIKVGTPVAMDMLTVSFPPSNGTFRTDILPTVLPLLRFLNATNSFFFLDVYPYFPWASNPAKISLDFALFRSEHLTYTDPESGFVYTNLLDQMIDSVIAAMAKLGFPDIRMAIAETGWPNDGDVDEPGANVHNAATYNRNLVRKVMADPPTGTPARPGVAMMAFVFSLYDEDLKDGPKTERHWGLVRPTGTPVYEIDLSGERSTYGDEALQSPGNDQAYEGQIWCVVPRRSTEANVSELAKAAAEACGRLNGTCRDALAPGKECYKPISVAWHASYAFSAYWAKFRGKGVHCHFNGLASETTDDPSHDDCEFPSVTL